MLLEQFYIIILIILISLYITFNIYNKIAPKKRIITTGAFGLALRLGSLLMKENISDVNKNYYNDILNLVLLRLSSFNNKKIYFDNMYTFQREFWIALTEANFYNDHKDLMEFLVYLSNAEYKKMIYYLIFKLFKFPLIIYRIYSSSSNGMEIITKLGLLETILKAYQVSSIMNVDLETSIRRMRFFRDIQIYDRKLKTKMITRQVRFPMVGSEVCPFINYVKKSCVSNNILNYSILIIEKNIVFEFKQYTCNEHISCIYYQDKNGIIDHLENWDFWKDDDYWLKTYPIEKEILKNKSKVNFLDILF